MSRMSVLPSSRYVRVSQGLYLSPEGNGLPPDLDGAVRRGHGLDVLGRADDIAVSAKRHLKRAITMAGETHSTRPWSLRYRSYAHLGAPRSVSLPGVCPDAEFVLSVVVEAGEDGLPLRGAAHTLLLR